MQICILAKNEDVEVVREKARQEIEIFANDPKILGIGLSEKGAKPATHWFCTFNASEEMFLKLKSIQELTNIEQINPRSFLRKINLRPIKD